ncbi:hypothetical protein NON20_23685 (plasmid) [Synechocystis sp. B12]|nr:hypothetical protein NON20_23685 [Synechocystis sp. B12]
MAGEVLVDHGPLAPHDLQHFFRVDADVVLVGGQALAFWADAYGILSSAAAAGLTRDIDFFGNRTAAKEHALRLRAHFPNRVSYKLATLNDPPPSSAVICVSDYLGVAEPLIIDYVIAMAGYVADTEARMFARAIPVDAYGVSFRVMHPFDCLKSRVHNLISIPAKRTELGIEQCRTAVAVARAVLEATCAEGGAAERDRALPLAEAVIELALHPNAMDIRQQFAINVLDAIPVDAFVTRFPTHRWPRAVRYIDDRFARRFRRAPHASADALRGSTAVVAVCT